jgi:hypothetical protein
MVRAGRLVTAISTLGVWAVRVVLALLLFVAPHPDSEVMAAPASPSLGEVKALRPGSELRLAASRSANIGRLTLEDPAGLHARVRKDGIGLRLETHPILPNGADRLALALQPWITAASLDDLGLRLKLAGGVEHSIRREGRTKLVLELKLPTRKSSPSPVRRPELLTALAPAAGPPPNAAPSQLAAVQAIHVRWKRPVPAAIFRRAGVLWAVFGASRRELAGISHLVGVQELPALEQSDLSALRFRVPPSTSVHVERSDADWVLRIGMDAAPPVATVAIRDRNRRVQLGAEGRLATIKDPDSGDTLHLLLTNHAGFAQPEPRAWVDLELLPTITGLAWRNLSDGVTAVLNRVQFEAHSFGRGSG